MKYETKKVNHQENLCIIFAQMTSITINVCAKVVTVGVREIYFDLDEVSEEIIVKVVGVDEAVDDGVVMFLSPN